MPAAIVYEQPLNERTRTLLRLEFLFRKAQHHMPGHSYWDTRAAIEALIDILNLFGRTDLKGELIKELERQGQQLARLAENPEVDPDRIRSVIGEVRALSEGLYGNAEKIEEPLRASEFLSAVRQRCAIPGGCCDFDLPAYHRWLQTPEIDRQSQIVQWMEYIAPIQRAVKLILRLTRESATISAATAQAGFYQQSLESSPSCRIIRVMLPVDTPWYPEISGGRHRFTIRFMRPSLIERPAQVEDDVPFRLSLCLM